MSAIIPNEVVVPEKHKRRFLDMVEKKTPNECWPWTGYRTELGYGKFQFEYKLTLAHRVAYSIHHNGLKRGVHILHRCDNPPCCNPSHLFAGTIAENNADMAAKGRYYKPNGELNPASKLKARQVICILKRWLNGGSPTALAQRFNVSIKTIEAIVSGRSWSQITGLPRKSNR